MKFVPKQIDKIMNVFFSNKNFKKNIVHTLLD